MNSRFSIAVHILTLLAGADDGKMTSEFIATSVGTNPVVVRRQLALLREAGLVSSKGARGGGWMLAKRADKIKLSEIRHALGDEAGFRMHRNEPHPNCPTGKRVKQALADVYEDIDDVVAKRLGRWTVQDMLTRVRA